MGQFLQQEIEFLKVEEGKPLIAQSWPKVDSLELQGQGIYYFDILVENQFVGRLPLIVFQESLPSGRVERGPLRGEFLSLEYGHMVEALISPEPDSELALTFTRIMEALAPPEAGPFRLSPSALVFGLSAPAGFSAEHTVTVQAQDGQGNLLMPDVVMNVVLQSRLPGELFWTQGLLLDELAYPGPGDYHFVISVGGKQVGDVQLHVRLPPGTPASA